jgi:hypothetical protein
MQPTLIEKIEKFSQLPDQDCAVIIQNYFLEALKSDTYIDWDLVTKFIATPYADREALCKLFNSAIKKNIQQIAGITIGDWIRKYQDQYQNKERNPDTFFEYVNNTPEIKRMPKKDQLLLARTLRIYDYLLVIPIDDLDGPVSNILRFAMRSEATPGETTERAPERRPVEMKTENLPIDVATERYPELGEQLITSSHIKLKIFPEPVRPSIKNWLSDYTFTVGVSNRDPIMRGNYLFKSENTRNLSQEDRTKLTAILKSFEEKTPLAVNVNTRQVVFSAPEKKVVRELPERPRFNQNISRNNFPRAEIKETENTYYPTQKITGSQPRFQTDEERISAWRRNLPQKEELEEKTVASNVHFSSPQIFSTEKPPETTRPIQPNYAPKAPVTRINYSTPRPMPKNVVDLREE